MHYNYQPESQKTKNLRHAMFYIFPNNSVIIDCKKIELVVLKKYHLEFSKGKNMISPPAIFRLCYCSSTMAFETMSAPVSGNLKKNLKLLTKSLALDIATQSSFIILVEILYRKGYKVLAWFIAVAPIIIFSAIFYISILLQYYIINKSKHRVVVPSIDDLPITKSYAIKRRIENISKEKYPTFLL